MLPSLLRTAAAASATTTNISSIAVVRCSLFRTVSRTVKFSASTQTCSGITGRQQARVFFSTQQSGHTTAVNLNNSNNTTSSTSRSSNNSPNKTPPISSLDAANDDSERLIAEHARQPQTSVSLQALMRTGQGEFLHKTFGEDTRQRHAATDLVLMQVGGFLRRELPIRLAHRIHDLDNVPVLRDMPSVRAVRELYRLSHQELIAHPEKIDSTALEADFAATVERIYERHANVLVQMARGAFEFRAAVRKQGAKVEFELQEETHQFLDRFYLCRIGIRVLIGQYLALRQPPVENYIGIICSHTSPYEIVKRAIDDAAFMCTRKYGDAPEVIMSGRLDLTFPYVPTHLRKCENCFELVSVVAAQLVKSHVCTLCTNRRLYYARTAEKQHESDSRMARCGWGLSTYQSCHSRRR